MDGIAEIGSVFFNRQISIANCNIPTCVDVPIWIKEN